MLTDARGLALSTDDPASLEAFERALLLYQVYEGNPLQVIDDALARDPGFVMGHCLRGALIAGAAERALEPMLRAAVEAGEALASGATARERAHLGALRAWLDGDYRGAVARWGRIVLEWPRDALALQAAHLGDFYLGQQAALRDHVAAALHAWDEGVPGWSFVLGMYAFGLEENGDHARAEAAGRRAVEQAPRDAWAAHAVAHVMEMEGRVDEGIRWLEATGAGWAPDNTFAFHNHWHRALFHLDRGDLQGALDLYDARVHPRAAELALELVDASALLWRLHLLGVNVSDRAARLADEWAPRASDRYLAFNDVHAVMAALAAGRERAAEALVAELEAAAAGAAGQGTNAEMAREVGLPVARALLAFARGDHGRCVDGLAAVRPVAHRFGGSHAQRDVLGLTALEAALRGGRLQVARALASERTRLRPANPAGWRATARVLEAAGDAARAAAARRQALRLAGGADAVA